MEQKYKLGQEAYYFEMLYGKPTIKQAEVKGVYVKDGRIYYKLVGEVNRPQEVLYSTEQEAKDTMIERIANL